MEGSAYEILESVTQRTLHANNFARSSTQASLLLTDLLSRYLTLVTSTCAKYAEHNGRVHLTPWDALAALDELGVSAEELQDYSTGEGQEFRRYGMHSGRRREDIAEFRAHLAEGLPLERDFIPLQYGPYDTDVEMDEDEDMEDADEPIVPGVRGDDVMEDIHRISRQPFLHSGFANPTAEPWVPLRTRPPQLPLSPVSNPGSPTRKRQRIDNWNAPSHVPGFLPPFPVTLPAEEAPSQTAGPSDKPIAMQPPPLTVTNRQSTPSLPSTSAQPQQSQTQAITMQPTSSDYLTRIPYSQSSLANVPDWHLPKSSHQLPKPPEPPQPMATPQTLPSLLKAYHHILTHRVQQPHPSTAPSALDALNQLSASATPQRHRAAMAMLLLIQNETRWEPGDITYSPGVPRLAPIGPSYPIPVASAIKDDGPNGSADPSASKLPTAFSRPVTAAMSKASRLPELSRYILSPAVQNRATKLGHPPILTRGDKKLHYGHGVPAPWNSTRDSSASNNTASAKGKEPMVNGKINGAVNGTQPAQKDDGPKPVLPDAVMYATWDYQTKSYKDPLHIRGHRHGGGGGGDGGGSSVSEKPTITLGPSRMKSVDAK